MIFVKTTPGSLETVEPPVLLAMYFLNVRVVVFVLFFLFFLQRVEEATHRDNSA